MDVTKTLSRAIEAGEVLLVKYHGGSKPGETRQLSPIAFVSDDKIRAHCHASGRNKVFAIEIDRSGNKWFGTWGNGVTRYDGTNWTWLSGPNVGGWFGTYGAKGVAEKNEYFTVHDNMWATMNAGRGPALAAPMPASQIAGWVRDYRGIFALAPAAPAPPPRAVGLGD